MEYDRVPSRFIDEINARDIEVIGSRPRTPTANSWDAKANKYLNRGQYGLLDEKRKTHARPSLIFLDINMPLMDGFEFLDHYNKLPKSKKADIVIVFLTTSDSQKDKLKAISNNLIFEFIQKPLRKDELLKIKDEYFKAFP